MIVERVITGINVESTPLAIEFTNRWQGREIGQEAFFASSDDGGPDGTATCHNKLAPALRQGSVFQKDVLNLAVAVGSYAISSSGQTAKLASHSPRVENVQHIALVLICNQLSNLIKSAIIVAAAVRRIRENSILIAYEVAG